MDKLGKIRGIAICITIFLIVFFSILFSSTSQSFLGFDFLSPSQEEIPVLHSIGLNSETYKYSDGTFNTVIYSEAINFDKLVNLTQEGDDLILNVDGKISKIKLKIKDNSGRMDISKLMEKSGAASHTKDIERKKIFKNVSNPIFDERGELMGTEEQVVNESAIKFGWNFNNLPPAVFNNLEEFSVELETESEYEQTSQGWIVDGVVVDFSDIIKEDYILETNVSDKSFRIKDNPGKGKTFKTPSIVLDPLIQQQFTSQDTFIDSSTAATQNRNFGANTVMRVDGDREYRSLVLFDLSEIVANATINYAYLNIYGATGTTGTDLEVNAITSAWDEGTGTEASPTNDGATWNNRTTSVAWTSAGGDFNTTVIGTGDYASGYAATDITTGVSWIARGLITNNGFIISSPATAALSFNTKEFTGTARDPYINISWSYPSPTPNFVSPVNNTVVTSSSVNFICNATLQGVNTNANITGADFYYCSGATCDPVSELVATKNFNTTNGITPGALGNKTIVLNWTTTLASDGVYRWQCGFDVKYEDGVTFAFHTPTEEIRTITLDTTKPLIDYASPTETSSTYLNRNNIRINVTATDTSLANITIRLYNLTALVNQTTTTTSPNYVNITSLADGNYTFNATATDQVGNQNSTSSRTVVVDTVKPLITYVSPTENSGVNKSQTFIAVNVTLTEINFANITFRLYNTTSNVNTTTFTSSLSSYFINWTNLPNQNYTYNVTVTDRANNINSSVSRTIKLDTARPGVTIVRPTAGMFYATSAPVFNVTLNEDGGTVQYTLNSGVNNFSMSSTNLRNYNATNTSIANGAYTIRIYSNDTAGNRNDTTTASFTIDTINPGVVINYPSNNSNFSTTSIQVNFTATDTNLGTCRTTKNGGTTNTTRTCTTGTIVNFTDTYSEGLNTVIVYTNDSAGNINSTSTTFRVDTTAPTLTYVTPTQSSGVYLSRNFIQVNVTGTDSGVGLSSILVRLYNSTHTQINTSLTTTSPNYINFSGLSDGIYFYNVTGNDTLNNAAVLTSRNITLDRTIPLISFGTGTETTESNFSRTWIYVNVSASDTNEANITFRLHNSTSQVNVTTYSTAVRTINWTNLPTGVYTYNVTIVDKASNSNVTETRLIRLDTSGPTITIDHPQSTNYRDEYDYNLSLNLTVTDSVSSVATILYSLNGAANVTFTSNTTILPAAGSNTLIVFANDTAGNPSTSTRQFNLTFTPKIDDTVVSDTEDVGYYADIANFENSLDGFSTGCGGAPQVTYVGGYDGFGAKLNSTGGDGNACMTKQINGSNVSGYNFFFYGKGWVRAAIWNGSKYLSYTEEVDSGCIVTGANSIAATCNGNLAYDDWTLFKVTTNETASTSSTHPKIYFYNKNNGTIGENTVAYYDFVASGAVYQRDSIDRELSSWWKFDKNWSIQEDSITGINASSTAAIFTTEGKIGGAYFFDGINDAVATNVPSNSISNNSWTVGAWINARKISGASLGTRAIDLYKGSGSSGLILSTGSTDKLQLYWVNSSTTAFTQNIATINVNTWYHYYVTYNGSLLSSYVDGQLILTNTTTFLGFNADDVDIGFGAGGSYWNGTIDEVRIYNRSLSASEIQSLYSITNPTFQEYSNTTINVTTTDEDTAQGSLYYSWFVNGVSVLTGFAQTVFNWIFTLQNNQVQVVINDSNGYNVTQTFNITTTFVNPTINFTSPTPTNNTYQTSTSVTVNLTGTEVNRQAVLIEFGGTNYSATCTGTSPYACNYTFSGLADNVYNYYGWINDTVGNTNRTETRRVTVDTTNPGIVYVNPTDSNNTYLNRGYILINTTSTDTNLANITIRLYNTTSLVNQTTTSTSPNFVNISSLTDGTYYFNATSTDLAGNQNSTQTRTVIVDTTFPRLNITYPLNNSNFSTATVTINYTLTETNPFNCWYTNNSGINNNSLTCGTNLTNYVWNEGLNNITIYANDSAGNINSSSVRFRVDTIAPSLTVSSPTSTIYRDQYSYNLSLNISASDSGVGTISTYFYSLNGASNISFTPNTTINPTAGSNTLLVYVNDTLGNLNTSSLIQFNMTFTPKIDNINISNSSTSYSRSDLTNSTSGLVGWWKFDRNHTTQLDSSISSANGTITAQFTDSGRIGGAYNFSGTSQYMIATIPTITTPFSVAFWYLPSTTPSGTAQIIGLQGAGTYPKIEARVTGRILFYLGNEKYRYTSNNAIVGGQWHHVVAVTNGTNVSQIHMYINGVLADGNGGADTGTYVEPTTALKVGNNSRTDTIDELMIYNRSLSAAEIQSLYSITNPTFQEYSNTTINVTTTDEDTSAGNLYYSWFVNGVSVLTGLAQSIFNYIFTLQNQQVTLIVNDSNNYSVTQNWNITTTFVNPTINFTSPTPSNNTYQSATSFIANFTGTEANLQTGWIQMNGVNYSATCTGTSPYYCNRTFSGLSDGIYNYFAAVNDTVGNQNFTETRTLTVDTTKAIITFVSPTEASNTNFSRNYILANVTITETNFANITFKLFNSTAQVNETSYATQTLFINWSSLPEEIYTYNVTVTDLANNINTSQTRTIRLDRTAPTVTILSPTSTNYRDIYAYNLSLNVSATDVGTGIISTYWWTRTAGVTNTTFTPNSTVTGLVAGANTLTVYSNDSVGNIGSSTVLFNLTFTPKIDEVNVSNSSISYSRNNINQTNLLGYWKFDINHTAFQDYGSLSNNATIASTATSFSRFISEGKIGGGVDIDGCFSCSSSVNPLSSPLIITGLNYTQLTISIWINPGALQYNATNNPNPGFGWRSYNELLIQPNSNNQTYLCNAQFGNASSSASTTLSNCYNVTQGRQWIHLVGTYNGTQTKLYKDGQLVGTSSSLSSVIPISYTAWGNPSNTQLKLGKDLGGNVADRYNGTLDEVIIWNRTLDAAEIYNLYSITNPTFQEYSNTTINVTTTDEDTAQGSLYYSWFVNGVSVLTGFAQTVFNWIFTLQNNQVQVVINDSNGYNVTQTFNITTTFVNPTINFTSPTPTNNTYQTSTSVTVNLTGTEVNRQAVLIEFGGTNYSATCTGTSPYACNYTFSGLADNVYNYYGWINDTVGNTNRTETRRVTVDTIQPNISYVSPTESNNSYLNRNNTLINVTVTDVNYANVTIRLYNSTALINQTSSTSNNLFVNITNLKEGTYYFNATSTDLAGNKNSTQTRQILIDITKPVPTFVSPTQSSGVNLSVNYILANVTVTETNFANITFKLYNTTSLVNQTVYSSALSSYSINWSGLPNQDYSYNATVTDLSNNINSTETRIIRLDTTNPNATLISPSNASYANSSSQNFTVNATDNLGIKNATLFIYNSTSLVNQTTVSVSSGSTIQQMFGILVSLADNVYTWFYQIFDWSGNSFTTANNTLTIDTTKTLIQFVSPTDSNNTYLNRGYILINTTSTDTNLANITIRLYNTTSLVNQTTTSTSPNFVNISSLTDGTYYFNATSTDLAGNQNSTQTRTVIVDTTFPRLNITYPLNNSNFSTATVTINYTLTETNPFNCWYTNNSGINNNSITCGTNLTNYIWGEGLNNITIYANDSAGNINSTSVTFRVDTTAPTINIAYPTSTEYRDIYSYNLSLNLTITDAGVGEQARWWSINGGTTNTTFTGNTTIVGLSAGANTLYVYTNDTFGYSSSSSVTFNMTFTPKIDNINISNSSTSYAREDILNGLVGWWRLDENNTNQRDDAGGDNNGTVTGTVGNALFTDSGKVGGAYTLKSGGRVNVADSSVLRPGNISISLWVNPTNWTTDTTAEILVRKVNSTSHGYSLLYLNSGSSLYFDFGSNGGNDRWRTGYSPSLNEWVFLTATRNDSGRFFYVNGQLFNSTTDSGSPGLATDVSTLGIGAQSSGTFGLNGSIDEVRIYNRSLSASEIQSLYSITNPTFQEYSNTTINVTTTDEDTSAGNLYYSWFVNGVSVLTGFAQTVFNWIFTLQNNQVQVVINDSTGYNVTQTFNITTTFVNPTINFTSPTPTNNTYQSSTSFIANFTGTEVNLQTGWIQMNNVNYSATCTGTSPYYCNRTFSGLSDGIYNYFAAVNDTVGNQNFTETRTLTIDTVNPSVTIHAPLSQSYNSNVSLVLNFTSSDTNLQACWWNIDSGANTTVTCNVSTTFNASEATHTIYTFANDSAGNIGTANVTFSINLAPPQIAIHEPDDNIWINYTNNVKFNYTATDSDGISSARFYIDSTGTWHVNQTHNPTSGVSDTFYINLTQGTFKWNILVNDTGNNLVWAAPTNRTIHVDSIYPLIQFVSPTESSNTNFSRNYILANVTVTETNFANITFKLYNTTSEVNTSTYTSAIYFVNWSSLNDGLYTYNVTIVDSANNKNSTESRTIRLDRTAPSLTVSSPTSTIYRDQYSYNLSLNISASDSGVGTISTYFYSLNGASNISFTPNTTISPVAGSNTLLVYVNDTLGNLNTSSLIQFNMTFTPKIDNTIITNETQNWWLNFDGLDDVVTVSNFQSMPLNTNVSYMAWVKVLGLYNQSSGFNRVGILYDGSRELAIYRNGNGVGLRDDFIFYESNTNVSYEVYGNIETDKWYFVAGTSNDTATCLYIDGVLDGCGASDGSGGGGTTFRIGRQTDTLNGSIDEVRIYNRSLSASEILAINNSGLISNSSLNSTGLVSWYNFNDYGDGILTDNANDYDGVISGADWSNTYSREEPNLLDGLVAWWRLDENNTNQIDTIGGDNNGTVVGGASLDDEGKIGASYEFDGVNGGVRVTNITQNQNILNLTQYSVAYWFYMDDNGTNWLSQVDKGVHGTQGTPGVHSGYAFLTPSAANGCGVLWEVYRNTSWTSLFKYNQECAQWHFVVGTFNGTVATLYFDNVLADGPDTITDSVEWGSLALGIGINEAGTGGYLDGKIDEVRIYNRSLSASEIQSLYSITNPTFQEYSNTTINVTTTDEDTSAGNLYYSWFVNGVSVLTGFAQTVFNWIFTLQNNQVQVVINDSNGYNVTQTFNITTTFVNPTINFTSPTPTNNTYQTSLSTTINVTGTEENRDTVWLWWLFGGTQANYTMQCSGDPSYTCNFTQVSSDFDGIRYFRVYINDSVGNINQTETRQITIDRTFPRVNITYPLNNSNFSTATVTVNYTLVETNPFNCWYTNNSGINNNSITCGTNLTNYIWGEGLNNITIYANDSAGNINSSSVRFRVDTIAPSLTVSSPTSQNYKDQYSYNLSLNISASDSGVGTISTYFYSLNGASNISFTPNTTINPTAGSNTLLVYVNDTLGNLNTSSLIQFNMTFTPKIDNINISNSSTSYSLDDFTGGLEFYYNLDKNYTYQEEANNKMTLSFFAGSTKSYFTNDGKIGAAYEFMSAASGGGYMTNTSGVPSSIGFEFDNWTGMAWVRPTAGCVGYLERIVEFDSTGAGYPLVIRKNCASFSIAVYNGTANPSGTLGGADLNKWTHIAVVRYYNGTGKTVDIYVDGEFSSSFVDTTIGNLTGSNGNMAITIGGTTGGDRTFNGTIDEVRLYNRSLSASEIQSLYSITNPTFQEYSNTTINLTVTDEDTSGANLYYSWFVNGVSVLTGFAQTVFNWIFTLQNNQVQVVINDSNGYNVTQTFNITTTFVNPTINFTSPTPSNNTYQSATSFIANFTGTEANLQTGWIQMNGVNYSATCTGTSPYYCNRTFSGLSDGIYNYFAAVNDTVGNQNFTETRTLTVDTINPSMSFVTPTETNNSFLSRGYILINTTSTDTNLANITINLYNTTSLVNQTTTSTSPNFVNISSLPDGNYTFNATATDLANNMNVTETRQIVLDRSSPSVTINIPSGGEYFSNPTQTVFFTITDAALQSCYYTVNSGVTNTTVTCSAGSFTPTFSEGSVSLILYANDSAGNLGSNSVSFTIDTTYPNMSFVSPTPSDNTNTTSTNLFINVSVNETNERSITFEIENSTTTLNSTQFLTAVRTINFTGLTSNSYNYSVTVEDLADNSYTITRHINIDNVAPTLNILSPSSNNYAQTSFGLNYSVSDNLVGVSTCWYNVRNISNSAYLVSNTTLSSCQNTTFNVHAGDYDFEINLYANDTLNNLATTSTTIGVRTIAPAVVLVNPTSNQHFNRLTNIRFNFTATDLYDGISSCRLEGNWTGAWHINQTLTSVTSAAQTNFNLLNLTEGAWGWNVWCNDTYNNADYAQSNQSFTLDVTYPTVNISSPTNGSSVSTTFTLNYSINDLNIFTCSYNLLDSNNSWAFSPNQSLVCGNGTRQTTVGAGSYTLYIWGADRAGNENSTSVNITLASSSSSSGGGGTQTETVVEVPDTSTHLGDGKCNPEGNSDGIKEDFFNEPACPGFNIDSAIFGCFVDDPELTCFWDQNRAKYIGLFLGILAAIIAFTTVEDKSGREVKAYRYYILSRKNKKRRRR